MAVKKGTRKKKIIKRRNTVRSVWLGRVKRFGLIGGALVFTLWVGAWLHFSESYIKASDWLEQKTLTVSADMGFSVENILVEGRIHADADVLKALINVQKGDPLFSFNPAEAKELVERISWVRSAHVERRLPDTIYIGLEERKPLALWQKDGKLRLIDERGEEISTDRLSRFKSLIVVMGKGAPQKAPELLGNLSAEPILYERTQTVKWIERRRWNLTLDNNITVKLPEDDIGFALRRLALAQEEDELLDKDITAIDLREPDRIVVRTRPGAVQEYKAGIKTGSRI